jgi:hypothetical protein
MMKNAVCAIFLAYCTANKRSYCPKNRRNGGVFKKPESNHQKKKKDNLLIYNRKGTSLQP